MSSGSVPVTCGWCGEELDGLDDDHRCEKSHRAMLAVQTGNPEYLEGSE